MATLILQRSARSAQKSTDLASRCLLANGATAWTAKTLSQRLGSVARLFSSKPLGDDLIEGKTSAKVIQNSGGARTTPAFNPKGGSLVGVPGKRRAGKPVTNPTTIFFHSRRIYNRHDGDPQAQKKMKLAPHKIVKTPNGDVWVELNEPRCSATQIGDFLLVEGKVRRCPQGKVL
ncbi:hypothetical protein MKW92_049838 [Papaver armeniacum]|nr:hypothetical protein MKW92_049838 [Papaver armeniacum]